MELAFAENCSEGKFLLVVAKIVDAKLTETAIPCDQLSNKEVKQKYFKLPALILAEKQTLYGAPAIACYLARNSPLYKGDDRPFIDSWLSTFAAENSKVSSNVILPILGHKDYTNKFYHESLAEFKTFLHHLNSVNEFLVGSSLTLADLYGAAVLFKPFALIVDEGQKKAFGKVVEWFKRVTGEAAFAEVFGAPRFCKMALRPFLPAADTKKSKKKDSDSSSSSSSSSSDSDDGKKDKKKKEKKDKKDKKNKKDKKKNKDKDKDKDKKDKDKDDKDEEEVLKKPKNPLDQLPESPFVVDDFKRKFFANKTPETKRKFIQDYFWSNFDDKGWALWYIDYVKAEDECEVLYKTSNLLGGFIWRIDTMGRYGFGVHGIFGEEPNLELRGLYLWRGTEIPFFVKDHPSFEFYKTRKIDPKSEEDRKITEDFWCADEDEKVLGLRYREGKYFR
eukprot:TRINITY_DN214_c0_g1_i4.p1 TRINITY_DN214_c0_g1~~TRINITY_DN214_c0_g1_i4.p1  ORF type:complete len:448 (-),score=176.43 TRINITY_DN214_c0_g1_i4:76-1419(-)